MKKIEFKKGVEHIHFPLIPPTFTETDYEKEIKKIEKLKIKGVKCLEFSHRVYYKKGEIEFTNTEVIAHKKTNK